MTKKPKAGGVAAEQLRTIIARIEKLKDEQAAIGADIRDIFAEAKGNGFCVKTIRKVLSLRKMDAAERDEAEMTLDTYLHALGMQPDMFDETPEGTTDEEGEEKIKGQAGASIESQAHA